MNFQKFTQKSLDAVNSAQAIAAEYGNSQLTQLHLLLALLKQEDGLIGNLFAKMTGNSQAVAEHIETVTVGSNLLVGTDAEALAQAVTQVLEGDWKTAHIPDRWDGRSAERILQILTAPHNTPAATN